MSTFNDNAKFKIYVKADGGDDKWYELGNNGKTILSNNTYTKASLSSDDAGMKINTTTTFTANDEDEICIVCHKNSGTSGGTVGGDHGVLKLKYAKNKESTHFPLKYCTTDPINLGQSNNNNGTFTYTQWDFKDLSLTDAADMGGNSVDNLPIGDSSTVVSMGEDSTNNSFSSAMDTALNILIGKNNKGWNVSILDQYLGMGDQGYVYFPRIDSGEIDHGIGDHSNLPTSNESTNHKIQKIGGPSLHSQPVNINVSKSGYTMIGWYKSWTNAFPKLVDPFNIVSKVHYYNSADNNYIELAENTGTDGHSDGKSTGAGNGNRAKVWNITTNLGSTPGIWVKVSKQLTDFETSGGMGNSNATTNPKAPFVFLTYSG